MNSEKTLSIIIPMYNSSATIVRTVNSLISHTQTFETQIILVDDGSIDDTISLARPMLNETDILISAKHEGVSHARNLGIEEATGQYIMFIDSDDLIEADLDPISGSFDIVSFSGKVQAKNNRKVINSGKIDLIDSMFGFSNEQYVADEFFGGPWSKLYNTSFIKNHKIRFNENLANSEDLIFNIDAILSAKQILLLNMNLYTYVNNEQSVTHSKDVRLLENHLTFMKILMRRRNDLHDHFINKVALLYLYQLLFRYFAYWPNKQDYMSYLSVTKLERYELNYKELARPIEKLSIFFLKNLGFRITVNLIRIAKKIFDE
jgi:glycosyltransferase involved in cell wall biosynthesis